MAIIFNNPVTGGLMPPILNGITGINSPINVPLIIFSNIELEFTSNDVFNINSGQSITLSANLNLYFYSNNIINIDSSFINTNVLNQISQFSGTLLLQTLGQTVLNNNQLLINTTTAIVLNAASLVFNANLYNFSNVPIFANNTAAILGGLITDDLYKFPSGALHVVI